MAPDDTSKSPAFQFYPRDFLSDANVIVMSLAERGAYITLIGHCWLEGSLPSSVTLLARMCGLSTAGMKRLWPALAPCFRNHPDQPERLIHPRLERERQKQADYREAGRLAGLASGRVRRERRTNDRSTDHPTDRERSSNGRRNEPPTELPTNGERSGNSASSSASASSDFRHKNTRARVDGEGTPDEARRASAFLERYSALYEKHRKGARYLSREVLDFAEALNLVRVWDDERLDKLATVFLTTDHEFAERGSRTVAQFRSMASWADGKLREAGL